MNRRKSSARRKAAGNAKRISDRRNVLLYVVITAVLICIFLAFGSLKKGFFIDEYLTFGFSNHQESLNDSIYIGVENGISYSGQELWDEYLTVRDGGRFDYVNVYKSQVSDVHPPLYYFFIHTVSSIFPDIPIMWTGLLVNVLFCIVIYWQLVWINRKLGIQKAAAIVLSAFFVLGVGFIGYEVVFFRMYALMTVWINFLLMLFFANRPEEKANLKYYLLLGVVLLGGLLTQYYFIIFAFFACLVYAVFVIIAKNWKKLIFSVVTVGAAGGLWLIVWPAALTHIFSGYRGTEAVENLLSGSFREDLWEYLEMLNSNIFGGIFFVILAVLICLSVVASGRVSDRLEDGGNYKTGYLYVLLIVPAFLYVALIAKIAPYHTLRYVIAVCAPLYIAAFAAMMNLALRISNQSGFAVLILGAVVLAGGYKNEIENLFNEEVAYVEAVSAYEDASCLYLYDSNYRITNNLLELRDVDSIVFMQADDWNEVVDAQAKQAECDDLLVYISDYTDLNHEDVLAYINEAYGFSESTELFSFGYSTCYILN